MPSNKTETHLAFGWKLHDKDRPQTVISDEIITSVIDNFGKEIKHFSDRLKEFDERIHEMNADIQNQKASNIGTLAIFVALFTFVSVEFQIFRSLDSWIIAAGFSFILLGGLLIFINLINELVYFQRGMRSKKGFLLNFSPFILIILGILFLWISTSQKVTLNKDKNNFTTTPNINIYLKEKYSEASPESNITIN